MPKYLDQTGLATFKSKLDETYANKSNTILSTNTIPITSAEIDELFPGSGHVVDLNLHYSSTTAPSDTSKLWVKTDTEPEKVSVSKDLSLGTETLSTLDTVLPTAISCMASGTVGKKIYLFGGYKDAYKNTIYRFDTTTKTITTLSTTLPTGICDMASAVIGTKIYLFGGQPGYSTYLDQIYCFDTTTETITTLSATLPIAISNMASGVVGNKIYLFGGQTASSTYSNKIYRFDTTTETITTLSTTVPSMIYGMASGVVGTKIYLFGGYNGITSKWESNEIYRFDTQTNTISTLSSTLPTAMVHIASGVMGTKIYLFGGEGGSRYTSYSNKIYRFDTRTNTISTLSSTLPIAISNIASGVIGTNVYLFGGHNSYISGNTSYNVYSSNIYRFAVSFALAENNLLLLDIGSNSFNLITGDTLAIEAKPKQIYIGNANDEGTYVESALYTNGAWQPIS